MTAEMNRSRLSVRTSSGASSATRIVFARGWSRSSAISPKPSPVPSRAMHASPSSTSATPPVTTK